MPKMLNDGAVEYEDDTPATESQVLIFMKLQCVVNNFSFLNVSCIVFSNLFYKIVEAHMPFSNVTVDGKGCCGIFILGSGT